MINLKNVEIKKAKAAAQNIKEYLLNIGCNNEEILESCNLVMSALERGQIMEEGFKVKIALAPYDFEKIKKALLLADKEAVEND